MIFLQYGWPGNVRQLQNVIRNIVVLNDASEVTLAMLPSPLDQAHLAQQLSPQPGTPLNHSNGKHPVLNFQAGAEGNNMPLIRRMEDVERETIEQAIALCEGNVPKAAVALGISASTIYRKKQLWETKR